MMRRKLFSMAVVGLSTLSIAAGPAPMAWNVDAAHTGINFSVNHFFTPVQGKFDNYEVELVYDKDDPTQSSVRVSIEVASVNTGNEKRNAHLMSGDFFEADAHPYITFVSESVRVVSPTELLVRGPLTIKGKSQIVELPVTILGVQPIPAEMREMLGGVVEIASFDSKLSVARGDFGVGTGSWAATLVVGGNVDIGISVEANRQ